MRRIPRPRVWARKARQFGIKQGFAPEIREEAAETAPGGEFPGDPTASSKGNRPGVAGPGSNGGSGGCIGAGVEAPNSAGKG